MKFTDYQDLHQVQADYQIKYQEIEFVSECWTDVSIIFDVDFDFHKNCCNIDQSDIARRELMILPVLKELYQNCSGIKGKPGFWVQSKLELDEKLSGTVDYIFTAQSELSKTLLSLPILILITQAKCNNFEQGWGHCLAALVTADHLNHHSRPVYGIVTDGKLWEFGRLYNQVFTKNSASYTITDLDKLFCMLNGLFSLATQDLKVENAP